MILRQLRSLQYVLLATLAVVVMVLFFQTRVQDIDRHNAHAQDLLHLKQYDTLLEEEILTTVALQMVQYDGIVETVGRIRALQRTLSVHSIGMAGTSGLEANKQIIAFSAMMDAKIDLVETIKSRAAIIRNTINFLPLEVSRLTFERHEVLDMQLSRLLSALLVQNINPAPHNLAEIQRLLREAENVQTAGIPPKGLDRILVHARANLKANADITDLMAQFLELPTRGTLDNIYNEHATFVLQQIKSANQFRMVLVALTMVLFVGLGFALHRMRKAHDRSQQLSRQFRDAVESISEGFAFFDGAGTLQFWNKTFARLHQSCSDALVQGTTYDDFYKACEASGVYLDVSAHKTGQPFELQTCDGIWMLASDSPMGDGGTACVRVDITENKHSEVELRKLSRAVEQSPASVIITDTNGIISYVNPKFSETTGYTAAEAIGNRPNMVSSGERPDSEYKDMWATISGGHEWRGEFHNKRKDGSLFWEYASISPILNEKNEITHFLAVKEDITERKLTMEQLVSAKEQAELASNAKTQFLANMSHELRTPLNAIIGFSEILKGEMFGPLGNAQYVDYTTNIHDSGHHLLGVINDILDISRIETGSMEIRESDVDLHAMALSCCDMMHERADSAKLDLQSDFKEDALCVNGDEMRLKQVMLNLLSNAIKFTPEGGEVSLNVYTTPTNEAVIKVRDTGCGIPKDMQGHVLEPFEQVSDIYTRNHEGSGLGLYLVNSFVKLHNGNIVIDSKVGQGTTVTVTLPALRTRAS